MKSRSARPAKFNQVIASVSNARTGITQFGKYLITGGLNAVLTGVIFALGLYAARAHYLLALIVAFSVGVVFTYVLNFLWVFRTESRLRFHRRFVQYLASNAGAFVVNLIALYYLVERLGGDPLLSQIVIMVVVVIANFLLAKYWSLRRRDGGAS